MSGATSQGLSDLHSVLPTGHCGPVNIVMFAVQPLHKRTVLGTKQTLYRKLLALHQARICGRPAFLLENSSPRGRNEKSDSRKLPNGNRQTSNQHCADWTAQLGGIHNTYG